MQLARLEHVNLTVSETDRMVELLQKLCGWHVRWQGPARDGGRSTHIGSEGEYLALYQPPAGLDHRFVKGEPLNHVGLLVDDLGTAEATVRAAGLAPFGHDTYDPGSRFYFFDWDGTEFEVVSYA